MPLQVFRGNVQAMPVYVGGIYLNPYRRYDVDMGGFAVANNPHNATALGTSGAGPCQIIVVHKAPGRGALGHYAAHPDPNMIVQGVRKMVDELGGPPIEDVVLAAGEVGANRNEQLKYELAIVAWVRAICQGARVRWPTAPPNGVWGACYYLPLTEQVGLFDMAPGGFVGSGDAANGITVHNY